MLCSKFLLFLLCAYLCYGHTPEDSSQILKLFDPNSELLVLATPVNKSVQDVSNLILDHVQCVQQGLTYNGCSECFATNVLMKLSSLNETEATTKVTDMTQLSVVLAHHMTNLKRECGKDGSSCYSYEGCRDEFLGRFAIDRDFLQENKSLESIEEILRNVKAIYSPLDNQHCFSAKSLLWEYNNSSEYDAFENIMRLMIGHLLKGDCIDVNGSVSDFTEYLFKEYGDGCGKVITAEGLKRMLRDLKNPPDLHDHGHGGHSHKHDGHSHNHEHDHNTCHEDHHDHDHDHDHKDHDHDHKDHDRDHKDHDHDHKDHDHDHDHKDHDHDHKDHDHDHDHKDHDHDHKDHSHDHKDQDHNHKDHDHDHKDHSHDHKDQDHNHKDHDHDHDHDHKDHSHDHKDHDHDHKDHDHDHNHKDHDHDHKDHSHDHKDQDHNHKDHDHDHKDHHHDHDRDHNHKDHSHNYTDHKHDHESSSSSNGILIEQNATATTHTLNPNAFLFSAALTESNFSRTENGKSSHQRDIKTEHEHTTLTEKCFDTDTLIQRFGQPPFTNITRSEFLQLCPALIQQTVSGVCKDSSKVSSPPSKAELYGYSSLAVLIISMASLCGVFLLPVMSKNIYHYIMMGFIGLAFSTMAGDALLHLIPQVIGLHSHGPGSHHSHGTDEEITFESIPNHLWIQLGILGAIYGLFLFETILETMSDNEEEKGSQSLGHSHIPGDVILKCVNHPVESAPPPSIGAVQNDGSKSKYDLPLDTNPSQSPLFKATPVCCGLTSLALVITLGDGIHNFVDGLSIGAAFSNGLNGGISTSLAVFCHELPQEFGDFVVLLSTGLTVKKALFVNFLSALTCFVGLYIGIELGEDETARNWMLAVTAGMFLYVALADMIPELKKSKCEKSIKMLFSKNIGALVGIGIMLVIAIYEEKIQV